MGKKVNKNKKNKAFTLVELIVVITILAILGTIAFITLKDFSSEARDSQRLTDISQFKSWIELYNARTSEYPMPDSPSAPVYIDDVVKYQWEIWELARKNAGISKIITDPLTWEYYWYSITWVWGEYEVKYELETASARILNSAFASYWVSEIDWNYNWVFSTTKRWAFVSMPSLFSDIPNGLDLSTPRISAFSRDKWWNPESFTPTLIATSTPKSTATHTDFINNIQNAYNGTPFETDQSIAKYMNVNTVTEQVKVVELAKWTFGSEAEFWVVQSCDWTAHWNPKKFYSSANVSFPLSDCSSVEKNFTCIDWTWLDSLSVAKMWSGYDFDSCSPIWAINCTANPSYLSPLSHTYNIWAYNHDDLISETVDILENNWTFKYTLTAKCYNWTYINVNETNSPTLVPWSCDYGYVEGVNTCTPWNCNAGTITWTNWEYSYATFNHWTTTTWNGSTPITWWAQNYSAILSCNLWTVSINSESSPTASCNSGYSSEEWSCKANCSAGTLNWVEASGYSYSSLNHGNTQTNVSWTKTIENWTKEYTATISCSDWTVSVSNETYANITNCNSGYAWDWASCKANCSAWTYVWTYNTYNYNSFEHNSRSTTWLYKDITWWTQTYLLHLDCNAWEVSIHSEWWTSVSCDSWYKKHWTICLLNCPAWSVNWSQASWYNYQNIEHYTSQENVSWIKLITNWYQEYKSTITCYDWAVSVWSETPWEITCNSWYTKKESACIEPPKFTQIKTWRESTCWITISWTVQCWGKINWELNPTNVSWLSSSAIKIAVWNANACAVLDTWWVQCWWNNFSWQLWNWDRSTSTDIYTPPWDVVWLTSWVSDIAIWYDHTCALLETWWVKCWGRADRWQLWNKSSSWVYLTPQDVDSLSSGISQISLWTYYSCALTNAWWVKCWWSNSWWQMWYNRTETSEITSPRYSYVHGLSSWVSQISTWSNHVCILLSTSWIKCWGYNSYWQLWDWTISSTHQLTDVTGLTSWVQEINTWGYSSCAITDSWNVKCWWDAYTLWSTSNSSFPVDLPWLGGSIDKLSLWSLFWCAKLSSWAAQCWWTNGSGQLWDWTTTRKYVPTYIIN